ncbi:lactoylglutathione lyase [Panacagrimonas perspica]|uniref:Lactoylglutathione lyase n=1 Tax=Panacagrimonas perspica TaxID=381431 RepID=A0A4R7NXM5_9GAMM|nr:VOC family protein [Panacagrimonas perspica]TDU25612.1 lactoylglutathione lyase [Panacagrimonas perspica]
MRLAKPHLDLGLFTNGIQEQRAFWTDTVGLRLDHELEMGPGWVQHRFDAWGSVIKVNHRSERLPVLPPSGYVGLSIVTDGPPLSARDADGNAVRTVARGTHGLVRIGITVRSPDPDRLTAFYCDVLEFDRVDERTVRAGDTLIFVERGPGGSDTEDFIGPGYRYLTVQIFDADQALREIAARGGRVARQAVSFRDVARYGLVKDPDGNWIEISARASLTGIKPV